ncbi:MAG: long-chain fatty acid--CoA ligase [Ketobacter sp.]|uniref:LuxE/PaaK family acyltransferase n=1 Tax=unclassified Ketobacter TaxID=2639109 RepID=UPI000F29C1D2|nr:MULTISPECIES: long-chain fatty acid--CoA ligase [unclassified Ketobacter]RLT90558.1 MAG: long-chain fatty acid--CoA ligase [Ketobacter sp. GenoA1]RLT99656.1 MAG: long-chain fatty acid--CoA ligase [Ketobacter sp.]
MTQLNINSEDLLEHQSVPATDDLDYTIFGGESLDLPLSTQREIRETFVRSAFHQHIRGCSEYADFVARKNIDTEHVALDTIPVIPVSAFKEQTLTSLPVAQIEKWSLSSGTRGTQSKVGRDQKSLERLLGSIHTGMEMLGQWHEDQVDVVHLGPTRNEAGDIWFLYVMSLIELIHPTTHFVASGTLQSRQAIDRIIDTLHRSDQDIIVVGAPFLVIELTNVIEHRQLDIAAQDRLMVVTAGGWKRHSGMELTRAAFNERVCRVFGLSSDAQVRDIFNQVELNTAFVECSAHRKHVPPWVYASTRHADDLSVQRSGELGLLSYLDASATSYPAFIVTDDVGRVYEGTCPCGREGVTMEVVRRLTRAAARGCAMAIDRKTSALVPTEETDNESDDV